MSKVIASPIRWAGSKKKLLNEMLIMFDRQKNHYIEPFLGSGVVLLNVLKEEIYEDYYVNDSNKDIIRFYIILKDNPKLLINNIKKYVDYYNSFDSIEKKSEFFYKCREKYNKIDIDKDEKAFLFWFLMKTGFNGVYRINSKKQFNVPFGKRNKIILDEEKLYILSLLIQKVHFYSLDYIEFFSVMQKAGKIDGAFIYCDPPYIPETKSTEKHVIYCSKMFDHKQFVKETKKIMNENTSIMISMSESKKSKEIFYDDKLYQWDISGIIRKVNPLKNIKSKEIVFINYEL